MYCVVAKKKVKPVIVHKRIKIGFDYQALSNGGCTMSNAIDKDAFRDIPGGKNRLAYNEKICARSF